MNFPALAKRSFDQLREVEPFKTIFKKTFKQLKKISSANRRATKAHKTIDSFIDEILEHPQIKAELSCKAGCTFCCHTQISVNKDEASLLVDKIITGQVEVDLKKLAIQAQSGNSASDWYKLDHETRGCVFLDDDGMCKAYQNRPGVCRTNNAFSDAKFCSTEDGIEKPQRLLTTDRANMVLMASYAVSGEAGSLPSMLWKELEDKLDLIPKNPKDISKNVE